MKSCTDAGGAGAGANITTIEGLAEPDGTMHPMQAAFKECHGLQCGFCTPGMVMSAIDLVTDNPAPSEETIRAELDGNMCRCTGYQNIVKAVRQACRGHEPLRNGDHHGCQPDRQVGAPRRRTCVSSPGAGQYTDDMVLHGPDATRCSCARPMRMRASAHQARRAKAAPGVVASSPAPTWPTQGERPALRLADHQQRRQADEGAGASGAGAGQGAPRRRPGGAGGRRDLKQAKDAAELIEVDYEELPAVVDIVDALKPGAPQCTTMCPTTTVTTGASATRRRSMPAFAKAAHVTKLDIVNNRLIPNAIEPRAANGIVQPERRQLHAVRRQPEPARRAPADVRLRARAA